MKTEMIDEQLMEFGMCDIWSGYFYFHTGLIMTLKDPMCIHRITKSLYPMLGEKFGMKPTAIERAMSHAVKRTWESGKGSLRKHINKKPTNREFIAIAADEILCKMKAAEQKEEERKRRRASSENVGVYFSFI